MIAQTKRRPHRTPTPAKRWAGGSPAAGAALMPLDYLLQVMRDPHASSGRRFEAAKAAAPLVHPSLARITYEAKPMDKAERARRRRLNSVSEAN
jgi:hypothetical protein